MFFGLDLLALMLHTEKLSRTGLTRLTGQTPRTAPMERKISPGQVIRFSLALFVAIAALAACKGQVEPTMEGGAKMAIKVTSTAFQEGTTMPTKYTGDGNDVSPPLAWSGIPDGAKSIALICDDPDAPVGTWVHWVLYNLPPNTAELAENVPRQDTLPNGARQGRNDFGKIGYGGPAPPPGPAHRYYFKIYALDAVLDLKPGDTKTQLVKAMEGHILAQGQLMGKYQR